MGNDQGGYKDCFPLWTGQLHRVIHGLIHQPNLRWAEGRKMWLDRAHLPVFGTQRGKGTGASLYTVFLLAQSGAHRPPHTDSFDTAASQMSISN